jgi:hypothetical protein
MGEGSS